MSGIAVLIVVILVSVFHKNNEQKFWNWFSENQDQISLIKSGNEPIADQLTQNLKNIDQNLTWEIGGSPKDTKVTFEISAGGIVSSFPEVIKLVAEMPSNLVKWNVVAFRQKEDTPEITYEGKDRNLSDFYFSSQKSGSKWDINIYVKDYQKGIDDSITYLFLDSLLGEYNTEMKLGGIDISDLGQKDVSTLTALKNIGQIII
jgi:hypothetical protein